MLGLTVAGSRAFRRGHGPKAFTAGEAASP